MIAESALMAVKVSGIAKPHKIVRDLPTEGIAIEARKMAGRDASAARVSMGTKQQDSQEKRLVAEIPTLDPAAKTAAFKPMQIGDLQRGGSVRARILPPEMLNEIIEQHSQSNLPPKPVDEPSAPADVINSAPESFVEQQPEKILAPRPAPEPTTEERVMQMADEMLPSAPMDKLSPILSPEEVEKLLNG